MVSSDFECAGSLGQISVSGTQGLSLRHTAMPLFVTLLYNNLLCIKKVSESGLCYLRQSDHTGHEWEIATAL